MHRMIVALVLCSSCVPTSYTFSPTTKGEVPRTPGPKGCEFTVLANSPDEDFVEVGTFKHYNGDMPKQESDFKKAIASRVCDVGGHAVVAKPGAYETATVIRYTRGFHL